MKKKFIVLLCFCMMLVLTASIMTGIDTCRTWTDDTDLRGQFTDGEMIVDSSDAEEEASFLLPEQVISFEQLCEKADVILRGRVSPESDRTVYTECTLTQVEVLDVYQGNVSSDMISVFEPAYIDDQIVRIVGAYQLAEDNKEYILFLQKIKCTLYNDQEYVYLPTTTALSKYQCKGDSMTGNVYRVSEDRETDYRKTCSYDALVDDPQLEKLYQLYQDKIQILIGGRK